MALKEKIKKARKLDKELYAMAKEGIRKNFHKYRTDKMLWALVAVEVILIMAVIFALIFLFDPNTDFLDKVSLSIGIKGISDPMPWELKFILFLATIVVAWKLYGYTEWYRKKINRQI